MTLLLLLTTSISVPDMSYQVSLETIMMEDAIIEQQTR